MKYGRIVIIIGVVISLILQTHAKSKCITPTGQYKSRNRNDVDRYIIDIPGNPKMYTPNRKYNVSLKLNPQFQQPRSFKNFMITLEPKKESSLVDDSYIRHDVGRFQFGLDTLSIFSSVCPNTVLEANSLLKTEVQLFWIAPPINSGCVAIKATVIESKENWFSEDGALTKVLCEETLENENTQPPVLRTCCACAEAKYEVSFEGLWTRNTHPKDFPFDVWSTKFSDIIGASHKYGSTFWMYGAISTDGLKNFAETGNTTTLEQELKAMSENVRTIIKARGLQYPNITLSSYAAFRVDNQNHLVTLVSKIIPSPDWIVGVSNLELCRSDCSWEESRVLNLYPIDAGTDDGVSYTSRNEPSLPRQPIRKITSNSPNDPRSPFYDKTGEPMKPMAKLHLTRQRLYEKVCDEIRAEEEEEIEEQGGPCATTDWSEWSVCTKPCGEGTKSRRREFISPENRENCDPHILVQEKPCFGQSKVCNKYNYGHSDDDNTNNDGNENEDNNGADNNDYK